MKNNLAQWEGAGYNEKDPAVIARRTRLFDKYIRPNLNMIYKLCVKYSYSFDNVEENYNSVLFNFYRRIETYDEDRPLTTWLHIVTKRQVITLERSRLRHTNVDECLDVDECVDEAFEEDSKSFVFLSEDNYKEMYSDEVLCVLAKMNPLHRQTFLLHQSGYLLREIVEIEHNRGFLPSKNIETIKGRILLAKKFLKENLKDKYPARHAKSTQ